jgi:SWI/SNF-related matrix-associated actin-dependent regulator 1 of chromatin subfamily A
MELIKNKNGLYIALFEYPRTYEAQRAGFEWNTKEKRWATTSIDIASKFFQYAHGELKLELEERLAERKQQRVEHQKRLLSAVEESRAIKSEFDVPAPDGKHYLPFQKAGIEFFSKRRNVILGDEMGLGKTIQAIGLINLDDTIDKVLVICPASLRLNWMKEISNWLVKPRSTGYARAKKPFPDTDIVIINYDILHKFQKELRQQEWDILIVDEAHCLKNGQSRRAQQVVGNKISTRYKRGLSPIEGRKIIFMTGTPIVNRPIDLWTLINRLDPDTWNNFADFNWTYCGGHSGTLRSIGASNLDKLQTKLRQTILLRRLKSEVLTDLPPKLRQVIELPKDSERGIIMAEIKAYKKHDTLLRELKRAAELVKASKDNQDYLDAVKRLSKTTRLAWGELARARKDTAIAKVPYVLAHLEDVSEKVVVFAHHREVIEKLKEGLGNDAVVLYGGMPMNARNNSVERFQDDPKIRFFIGSILAAGVGLTLTASSHVVFAELDWVPGNVMQAEDRCHRIGQRNSVLVQHLVFDESVDANMAKTIVSKQEIIDKALDHNLERASAN